MNRLIKTEGKQDRKVMRSTDRKALPRHEINKAVATPFITVILCCLSLPYNQACSGVKCVERLITYCFQHSESNNGRQGVEYRLLGL